MRGERSASVEVGKGASVEVGRVMGGRSASVEVGSGEGVEKCFCGGGEG